jgi:hypothetical protein
MAVIIVIALRLVVPLSILRWPLAGGLLSMVLDTIDVVLVDAIASVLGEPGEFGPFYAQIDKWLDLWYLSLELVVVRRWTEPLVRRAATALFAWRLIGVILFEITASHPLLFVFPNLFENLFLYVLIVRRFAPKLEPRTVPQLLLVLLVLFIPKAVQEYILHVEELHPWQWLRETIIRPILGEWLP